MQEALPYKGWTVPPISQFSGDVDKSTNQSSDQKPRGHVRDAASENAVVVFGRRGCCMSHVVKRLLNCQGVNPAVYDVDEEDENGVVEELELISSGEDGRKDDRRLQFPVVFIGGRWFGGLDRIMATHITGELIPVLKQAGALWL